MALVSYSLSDASGSESEDEIAEKVATISKELDVRSTDKEDNQIDVEKEEGNKLFSALPNPKTKTMLIDSDFQKKLLLNKPIVMPNKSTKDGKKSVKISVPSLSEFEDDLPRPLTKKTTESKKSTLFDILPPPKHSIGASSLNRLVPDSVKKANTVEKASVSKIPKKPLIKPIAVVAPIVQETIIDSDSDDETTDFFSLNSAPDTSIPDAVMDDVALLTQPVVTVEAPTEEAEITETTEAGTYPPTGDFVQISSDSLTLDEEAMQRLCGSKRRRPNIDAQIIDLSQSDIAPNQSDWMMKQLTEEKVVSRQGHRKNDGPSSQQKRKHQITYLAYRAKEQEQELQNQWANNRMTKKQTQSKYGF